MKSNNSDCPKCGQIIQNELIPANTGIVNGHEYVDLGLSIMWATCNIGATRPHEYGAYYAWGEITTKDNYNKGNSKTLGLILGEINKDSAYDPARANWGGSWKIPTKDQMLELKDKCKWESDILYDVKGMKITGPNGNSIFLPGAGYYEDNLRKYNGYGYYFSGTPFKSRYSREESKDEAWYLFFSMCGGVEIWGGFRELGYSVRPVIEYSSLISNKEEYLNRGKIRLSKKQNMELLIKEYPNIIEEELLQDGCYILKMKDSSVVCYDCRGDYKHKSDRLRGSGIRVNMQLTHYRSMVATRHIQKAHSNLYYSDIHTIYPIKPEDFETLIDTLQSNQKNLHKIIKGFTPIHGLDTQNRYFCSPSLGVIINIKPNGYQLNPPFCKAQAVYDAEEELSLMSPHSTGFTWWYYPGRMYSSVQWVEISKEDFLVAKQFIFDKEQEIYNLINSLSDEHILCR